MRITERLATIAPNPTNPYFFVVIYLGWAWIFWGFIILSGESVWTFPNVMLFYVGGLSPTVGGIVLTHRVGGWSGLRDLWDRTVNTRRIGPRWYLICIFLQPAITVVAAGLVLLLGASDQPLNPSIAVESLALLLTFTLLAGVVEEIGLSGYFVHRLLEFRGVVAVGVITGVVWATWHVPLWLMEDYYGAATIDPDPFYFFGGMVFVQIIYAWIYHNTAKSVLAAIIFHTMVNATGELLGPADVVERYVFFLTVVLCLLILIDEQWITVSDIRNEIRYRR
ncbi:CPBP family intramembrane glutamic endopeptidase [Natronococcus sp. A-GB7]|uniref:CPBP family intramembrane glutamic endopeptidase n=1 Tax=Natronococcus sp. A-GB7 TaxID=3037649 RepID=UPI00241F29D5|nr:CPBP family intramembrane glutamic endopeptidase [Natronococcus sp. A-GB7]MDG5820563.1 CPBP family intramembrane metalloprotease [Natronococcus sp. A-GB7]